MSGQGMFPPPGGPAPTNRFGTPMPPTPPTPPLVPYGASPRGHRYWGVWTGVAVIVVVALLVTVIRLHGGPVSSRHPGRTGLTAGLPSALIDSKPSLVSVVTPDSALAVAQAMWPLRNQALQTGDLSLLRRLETGSALIGDEVRSCACAAHPNPAFNPTIVVSAARQPHFPATFMARIVVPDLGSLPYVEQVMAFQRLSAARPWQVAFETETFWSEAPQLPQPASAGTYSPTRPASDGPQVRQLAARLAQQWQRAKDTGKVPRQIDPFEPGLWTDQRDKLLAAHPNGTNQAGGLLGRSTFSVDPADPVFVASDEEGMLGCTLIHRTLVLTAHPGQRLVQDDGRREFPAGLAPGSYHRVVVLGIAPMCFEGPSPNGRDDVEAFGGDETQETVSITGS